MKVGKKNTVNLNPLNYNLLLIGESGVGKTTVINEYCNRLAGEDGYLFLEMGKEDGADAIEGIPYVNCIDWDSEYNEELNTIGFETLIDDIVENKSADYSTLKVVVVDTYDELIPLAEQETIRVFNRENPTKKVKSIKAAWGGFMEGEKKAAELVLDKLWSLKNVGVHFIIIGHTKTREKTDPLTDTSYTQLTTNMSQTYFNAVKNKVHFLGVACIDRDIESKKTGKTNVVTKKEETKGVVKSERRQIVFRDDNYTVDSKSRFSQIEEKIPLDADSLIKTLRDAIEKEYKSKHNDKELAQEQKRQEKDSEENERKVAEQEKKNKENKKIQSKIDAIVDFFTENKGDVDAIKPVLDKCRELGYNNPKEIDTLENADVILSMIE